MFVARILGALGALGELRPSVLGPAATLAHMLERRHFRLGPGLIGAGSVE
jgi:hypothetical protein